MVSFSFFWLAYYILFVGSRMLKLFVGAALHELDPLYKDFTYSSKFSSLASSLGYKRPVVMQSMYIFKVLLFTYRLFVLNLGWVFQLSFLILWELSLCNFVIWTADFTSNLELEAKLCRTKIILLCTRIHRVVLVSGLLLKILH